MIPLHAPTADEYNTFHLLDETVRDYKNISSLSEMIKDIDKIIHPVVGKIFSNNISDVNLLFVFIFEKYSTGFGNYYRDYRKFKIINIDILPRDIWENICTELKKERYSCDLNNNVFYMYYQG